MAQNGQGMDPAVLDDIINRLLEFRQARTVRQVQMSEAEIRQLCNVSREIFLQQPNLLELEAPIKICGNFFSIFFCLFLLYLCVCCRFWLRFLGSLDAYCEISCSMILWSCIEIWARGDAWQCRW